MNDLLTFRRNIERRLNTDRRESHWEPAEAARYMAEVADRRARYTAHASHILTNIARPRLSILAGFFANAGAENQDFADRCTLLLGYSERFPASTRIAVGVEHDVRFENFWVGYEASIIPQFTKFNERDKLVLALDEIEDGRIVAWIEERLLEFLDAYLQIDRGGDGFDDEVATDPICGMKITRTSAAAIESYAGHPYFFCSLQCGELFRSQPKAYVRIKTM